MTENEKIIAALKGTGNISVAVIGDFCLDKYLYIDPKNDEVSVETGLKAYEVDHKAMAAGVGGTITNNLRSLGVNTICIGLIGDDGEGYELMKALKEVGADPSHMVKTDTLCTCTYTKPMRLEADGSYTEMNRFDFRNFTPPAPELEDAMMNELNKVIDGVSAVIVTDQYYQRNAAAVTDGLRAKLSALAGKRKDKIFFVDSRAFAAEYSNMIIKCNQYELIEYFAMGKGDPENMDDVIREGLAMCSRTGNISFITCGAKGMIVFTGEGYVEVPGFRVEGKIDITGAGDATNAGIVTGLSLGLSCPEAAKLACAVSSITIQQIGKTGTATVEQVADRLCGRPVKF
ncbi:MAG: carbohydrate kinase [Clostridia bacterium]|nr:carbohydrate kinase [Clostridia bacterium]